MQPSEAQTYRVEAKKFVAGLDVVDGKIVRAAPVLQRYALGRRIEWFEDYCRQRGWTILIVGGVSE